jgi:enamine deaminase RidA (YjgF/YER057c/UK114 family)
MIADTSTELVTTTSEGIAAVSLLRPDFEEFYLTVHPEGDGRSFDMFDKMREFLAEKNATVLKQYVFGGCRLHEKGMKALADTCGPIDWPVTWLQGDACSGTHLTGMQVYAIAGTPVGRIHLDGQCVGTTYEDEDAKYCLLGNLQETDTSLSRTEQARKTFEKMEEALAEAGMDFSNVVRTWLYLNDLLSWYDPFNAVRTQFFEERGVFDRMVPASTGIGTSNPAEGALVTGLLAMKTKTDKIRIEEVPSPLQCPALDYRSSFSRAVQVSLPDHSKLYISGTASIDPDGNTIYIDDTAKQIAHTMKVVEGILLSRGMDWNNTTRAIAYFKDTDDAPLLQDYCHKHGLPHMLFAIAHSDVCRDDLLFELELDAMAVR